MFLSVNIPPLPIGVLINHRPVAKNLAIVPGEVSESSHRMTKQTDNRANQVRACQPITVTYEYEDPDGHPRSTTKVNWYLDNVKVVTYTDQTELPVNVTQVNQELRVELMPHDGFEEGNMLTETVTIEESDCPVKPSPIYIPILLRLPPSVVVDPGTPTPTPFYELRLNPSHLQFAVMQTAGTIDNPQGTFPSSAPQIITLYNSGTGDLNLNKPITLTGEDFSLTDSCTNPLAPDKNCALNLIFAPQSKGIKTGMVSISSNAAGSPHVVNLSGTAIANPCTSGERYEPNDGRSQACEIKPGQLIEAYPNDKYDMYYFVLNETSSVRLTIRNFNENGGEGGWFQVHYNFENTSIAHDWYLKGTSTLPNASNPYALTNLSPGKYHVLVYSENPTQAETPYQLEIFFGVDSFEHP